MTATSKLPAQKSIHDTFAGMRAGHRIGLMPFLSAGYPDLATTSAAILALQAAGASAIEIGFPFSDPIADGPIIQESYTVALAGKVTVADIFKMIADVRAQGATLPLLGMVSISIVHRYGVARFAEAAKASGFSGLIIPDLPTPEANRVCDEVRAAGLDTVLLVAPSTAPERRKEIARLSSGFVYYLSVAGITGERDRLPADLAQNVQSLRELTDRPICVGFGISRPEHLTQLIGVADGAIVGSAFVRRLKDHAGEGPQRLAEHCANYARQLLEGAAR